MMPYQPYSITLSMALIIGIWLCLGHSVALRSLIGRLQCAPSNISSVFPGFLKDKIGKYARAKVKAIAEIEGRNNFPGVRKLFAANSIIGMAHNAITLANTIGNGRRAFNHGDSASLYICYMLRHCIYRQLEDDLTSSSGPDDIFMFEL